MTDNPDDLKFGMNVDKTWQQYGIVGIFLIWLLYKGQNCFVLVKYTLFLAPNSQDPVQHFTQAI